MNNAQEQEDEKEFPVTTFPVTCKVCRREWAKDEFLALGPANGGGTQQIENSHVVLTYRQCICSNTMVRRVS